MFLHCGSSKFANRPLPTMARNAASSTWLVLSLSIMGAAFLFGWWPLALAGVLIGALSGQGVLAVCFGFMLDIAYGPPPGLVHYLEFPFALCALAGWIVHYIAKQYLFDSSLQDRL